MPIMFPVETIPSRITNQSIYMRWTTEIALEEHPNVHWYKQHVVFQLAQ